MKLSKIFYFVIIAWLIQALGYNTPVGYILPIFTILLMAISTLLYIPFINTGMPRRQIFLKIITPIAICSCGIMIINILCTIIFQGSIYVITYSNIGQFILMCLFLITIEIAHLFTLTFFIIAFTSLKKFNIKACIYLSLGIIFTTLILGCKFAPVDYPMMGSDAIFSIIYLIICPHIITIPILIVTYKKFIKLDF